MKHPEFTSSRPDAWLGSDECRVYIVKVEAARKYLGVPFYHAGRDRNGLDCIGLLAVVAKDLGYQFLDNRNYSPGAHPDLMEAGISQFANKTRRTKTLHVGDIVIFAHKQQPLHCAIVSGDDLMIHCPSTGQRKVIETTIGRYAERIQSIWEWK